MSEPIETVVTDMRKFMGVYAMNHLSPNVSSSRGSADRRINRQLFMSPMTGRKRKISEADSQDNFSGLISRTPIRKSREEEEEYEEDANQFNEEQTEMIFSRDEISVAMNIDPDLRSTKLVYGLAQDIHEEDLNELQAAVQGEFTPGSMIVVDPATALKAAINNPPFAWTIHATTQYLIKNYEEFNHKLELTGSLQKFSTSATPTKFPSKSSQISELHTWEANFKEFCEKHCPEAYGIWDTCKIRYPVIPNALTLAKPLQEHGLTEKGYVTESEIETCLNSWIKSKLAYSTLNRNYSNTIAWLIAQIRSASKGVEILENNIKAIQNGDIAEMKSVVYLHYQELDEFMKMVYVRGLDSIEVKKDWTLRRFYDLLIRILLALQPLGISVPLKNQKFIYLYSAYLIYGDKGFQGTSREWLLNDYMDLPKCKESYEFLISKSHIDPDFSWTYKGVSDSNKRAKVLPAEALEKLGDSIYPIEADNTKSSDKATEISLR